MTAPPPLLKSIHVRCSLEHAFDTFVERVDLWWPKTHKKFPRSRLSLDARKGGAFKEVADDGSEHVMGVVHDVVRPHRLRYAWNPGKGAGPTDVVVTFVEDADGVVVEVVHSVGGSVDVWAERVAVFDRGWSAVLPAFAAAAATASPATR